MREEFNPFIKSCGTWTVPAAETKSIGLQADAPEPCFFTRHLDYFILTRQFASIYQDLVPSRQFYRDTKPSSIDRSR